MAERVDEMPAPRQSGKGKYPWHEWLDGSAWELVQGRDFQCSLSSIVTSARFAASTRHIDVQVIRKGDRVYLQAQR